MELTAEEGRVLGCLIEKQLTTPQQYPMTDNALLAACNQTTSRDPVVRYDVATLRMAIRGLRERQLLRTVHRPGERSEKHRHLLDDAGLAAEQQVLLALLLLRGPQTAAELRSRADRMHPFASTTDTEEVLQALAERVEPLVERLPRQPGQKEARYADLLVQTGAVPLASAALAATVSTEPAPVMQPGESDLTDLRREVAALRVEVEQLGAELREILQNRGGSV